MNRFSQKDRISFFSSSATEGSLVQVHFSLHMVSFTKSFTCEKR